MTKSELNIQVEILNNYYFQIETYNEMVDNMLDLRNLDLLEEDKIESVRISNYHISNIQKKILSIELDIEKSKKIIKAYNII